jgi:peptide/nickel transport system permease protein
MARRIARRLLLLVLVIFLVTVFNFIFILLAPGNPVDAGINLSATAADLQARKAALGLNDPPIQRYGRWIGKLARGDLGYSYASYQSVNAILAERVDPTLLLMGTALLLAYLIAIPIGIVSATRQYSALDYAVTGLSFLGISVPSFFFGLLGIYVFSLKLHWLPTGGMYSLGAEGGFWDRVAHLILPASVLAAAIAGKMARYVRSSMLDILGQDYLRTARSRGLGELTVVGKHALRNALIPIVTVIGLDIPLLIGGAVVTEQIFQWPGMGQLTIQSIASRDYPVLMAINLISAVFVVGSNLLTDIVYGIVDPRVRVE